MIPIAIQLKFAQSRLKAPRLEVGRNQGEMKEKLLAEITAYESIAQTLDKVKMLNEVADETIINPPLRWRREVKLA